MPLEAAGVVAGVKGQAVTHAPGTPPLPGMGPCFWRPKVPRQASQDRR